MKNNNSIRHAPYLWNSLAYDYDFWCSFVKWWYLQVFFFFFGTVRGVKGQKKSSKWKMIVTSAMCHISGRVAYDHDFWYTCVKWWYLVVLFSLFSNLVFFTVRGVKGQKMPKMKDNNYIRHSPYLRIIISYDHDFWYTFVKS